MAMYGLVFCLVLWAQLISMSIVPLPARNGSTVLALSPLPPSLRARGDAPLRNVYIIADVDYSIRKISSTTGQNLLNAHSMVHISGTATDGPLRIQVYQFERNPTSMAIQVVDWGAENSNQKIGLKSNAPTRTRMIWKLDGGTKLANAQLADPKTGKGAVLDTYARSPGYTLGTNDCNTFVKNLVEHLGLDAGPEFGDVYRRSAEWNSQGNIHAPEIELHLERVAQWNKDMVNPVTEFTLENPASPRFHDTTDPSDPRYVPWGEQIKVPDAMNLPPSPFDTTPPTLPDVEANPLQSSGQHDVCLRGLDRRCGAPQANSPKTISNLRMNGILSEISVITKELATAASIVGAALAPAFIILDFLNGEAVGGAFGAVGLTLGVAASLFEGPVGWVMAAIGIMFSILPAHAPGGGHNYPERDNAQRIIQYAMFGDAEHTGNEKCREGVDGQPGNPNCTAVYGPGVISAAFGWDNFDPVVFLLQFNDGRPMSIPDMAAAFYIADPHNPNDGVDKMAVIGYTPGVDCIDPSDCDPTMSSQLCYNPFFSINRAMITIPVINQTADQVYNRLLPQPGGDCKIVSDVSGRAYPEYNITFTGAPVAIACNLSASMNINGTATLINGTANPTNGTANPFTAQRPALTGSGNSSTDGSVHSVAVPPPSPFAQVLNASNAVCLGSPSTTYCFPNGTYSNQQGSFGFDSSKVNSLTLPTGASLAFTYERWGLDSTGLAETIVAYDPMNYTANIAPNDDGDFNRGIQGLSTAGRYRTFDCLLPTTPDPPVLCIFSGTNYQGDVYCLGAGGGNLTGSMQNQAQSIMLHGGVTAWIFSSFYGDAAGQLVSHSIADLSTETLGGSRNFNKVIMALYILPPSSQSTSQPAVGSTGQANSTTAAHPG